MSFNDHLHLPTSYNYPHTLLTPQPLPLYNHPYAQPSLYPYYVAMRLPVPPPPNAVQYPRIALRAADWSPTGQCFTGECKVVAKTQGSSLTAYACNAVFTISYVPVNEWYEISESTCLGPVLIDSSDLQVTWDATGKCPIVEATSTVGSHWTAAGLEAHGPCELLVTPFEGSEFGSYACSAFYTLQCQCEPLEDWKEVPKVAANDSDFHEEETSAAVYEEPHKTGSQNDVKSIPEYKSPKTEREYFEQFPLPKKVVPQPDSDKQKESTPVRSAARERSISGNARFEGHNANTVIKKQGRFSVSNADLCREDSKICTLLQNKAAEQSSREDDPITEPSLENSIPLKTFCYPIYKEFETSDSTLKNKQAGSITSKPQEGKEEENPKKPRLLSDLEKLLAEDELRVAAENKAQETGTQNIQKVKEFQVSENQGSSFVMHSDDSSEWEWDSDYEEDEEDEDEDDAKQQDCETDYIQKEKDNEFEAVGSQGSSEDDESCSEWESEEEEEDDAKQQDNECETIQKEKDDEFQAVGSQGSSDEDECCSEWESEEEDEDDSSEWETVEQ